MKKTINEASVLRAVETLASYKAAKANLETRLIENEEWWRLRHCDPQKTTPSAWLFNSVVNKHADAMDSIPTCTCLPREARDRDAAEMLDRILPCIFEETSFESVYSDCWYEKLKSGTGCYGVFWNPSLDFGLGNIDIRPVDLLNLYWEPGVSDIQDSKNVFHIELWDNETLSAAYPDLADNLASPSVDISHYIYDDAVDTSDKSAVIDWYYKKKKGNRTVLHYCKFVNNTLLYASENLPEYKERGFYDHGKYPFVLDTLYPVKGSPCGFGIIDSMKGTQMEIDTLGSSIIKNAKMASGRRFFVRADGALNEREFADWDKPFVHYSGSGDPNSSIMPINVPALPGTYVTILQNKIEELKETSGNRDFAQGSVTGGVTAYNAIAALQEAGSKTTRDMITASYRAFEQICQLIIELIRQFYLIPRCFRITGDNGIDFLSVSGEMLTAPIYDIKIRAYKKNAYSRASTNELACRLYEMGMFTGGNYQAAEICLSMMDFDGRDEMLSKMKKYAEVTKG